MLRHRVGLYKHTEESETLANREDEFHTNSLNYPNETDTKAHSTTFQKLPSVPVEEKAIANMPVRIEGNIEAWCHKFPFIFVK